MQPGDLASNVDSYTIPKGPFISRLLASKPPLANLTQFFRRDPYSEVLDLDCNSMASEAGVVNVRAYRNEPWIGGATLAVGVFDGITEDVEDHLPKQFRVSFYDNGLLKFASNGHTSLHRLVGQQVAYDLKLGAKIDFLSAGVARQRGAAYCEEVQQVCERSVCDHACFPQLTGMIAQSLFGFLASGELEGIERVLHVIGRAAEGSEEVLCLMQRVVKADL
jgi:hypothetical protein